MSFHNYINKQLLLNHQIDEELREIKVIDDHIVIIFQTKCAIFSLHNYCLDRIIKFETSKFKQILFLNASEILVTSNEGIYKLNLLTGTSQQLLSYQNQRYTSYNRYFEYFLMFTNSKIILHYIKKDNSESFCYTILPEKQIRKKNLKVQKMNFEKLNEDSKMVIYPEDVDKNLQKSISFQVFDCATDQVMHYQIAIEFDCRYILMFVKENDKSSFIIGVNLVGGQSLSSIFIYNHKQKVITYIFNYNTLIEKFININHQKQILRIQQRKNKKPTLKTINIKNGKDIVTLNLQNTKNLHIEDHCVFQFVQEKNKKIIKLNLWKPVSKLSCYAHFLSHAKNDKGQLLFNEYPHQDLLEQMISLLG